MADNPVPFMKFYEATGRANAAWQRIEDAICDVFSSTAICFITNSPLDRPEAFKMVSSIFYSSTNFRANLEMVSNVIDLAIKDAKIHAEWNAIKNRSNFLYKRHNTLAHGRVFGNASGASIVRASIHDVNAKQALTYIQVCACEESFNKIADRAAVLAIKIREHLILANPPARIRSTPQFQTTGGGFNRLDEPVLRR